MRVRLRVRPVERAADSRGGGGWRRGAYGEIPCEQLTLAPQTHCGAPRPDSAPRRFSHAPAAAPADALLGRERMSAPFRCRMQCAQPPSQVPAHACA